LVSNRVPLVADALPECMEEEPNDEPAAAQKVTLPIIINGRIDAPGDWDVFRFKGKAGQVVVAEVDARKLGSPLDSILRLTDDEDRQLAFNDDYPDKGDGLNTHHADSYIMVALPADGTYYLHLGDAQHHGGPEYAYRLRISEPCPDFALRIVPSGINLREGATTPVTAYALRKDGFSGDIRLTSRNLPQDFTLAGARISRGQDQVRFTITASGTLQGPLPLCLEGHATIAGREVLHAAMGAEDMMQAFAYHHLVPAQELLLTVTESRGRRAPLQLLGQTPVRLTPGQATTVCFSLPDGPFRNRIHFALDDPPEGISLRELSPNEDGMTAVLRAESGKAKPGLSGNLIVDAYAERAAGAGKGRAQANQSRVPLGTLPAIPFEIIQPGAKRP
jgi:hypothetical protein